MQIPENVCLAPLTTLGVGGPARYFVEVRTEAEAIEAVDFARLRDLPLFVLGGGSNLVVADGGFPGLVLKVAITNVSHLPGTLGQVVFEAGAGVAWDELVALTVNAGCAGLECLSGVPGTVGGTPVQNVGAYGQEVSETICGVRVLDLQSLQIRSFSNVECGFTYRSSIFNSSERGRYLILRVSFALAEGGAPAVRYKDMQEFFADRPGIPSLAKVREAVLEIRSRKAMLIIPGDEDSRSVGSFFKNPVVPQSTFENLSAYVATRGLELPGFTAGDGFRKIPAAWLVEHAGFSKGYQKGRVGISRRHALAIVNRGGATAADIVALKNEIQNRVSSEFGIELQPEPVFVGF